MAAFVAAGIGAGGAYLGVGEGLADTDRMRRSALAIQKPADHVHPNAILQHDLDRDGMVTLTELVRSLERRFALLDVDRDGSLSVLELAPQERPSGADPRATLQRMDGNRDGMLSSAEFLKGSQDVFWRFDANRDTVVTGAEIRGVIEAQQMLAQAQVPSRLRDRRAKRKQERTETGTRPGRIPIIVAIDLDEPRQKIANYFEDLDYRVIPVANEDELMAEIFNPKVQIVIFGLPMQTRFRNFLCSLITSRENLYFNKPGSDSILQHYTSESNLRSLADRIEQQLAGTAESPSGVGCLLPPAVDSRY